MVQNKSITPILTKGGGKNSITYLLSISYNLNLTAMGTTSAERGDLGGSNK